MSVSFDAFLEWAEDRFNGDVVVRGNEIKLNSIFREDHKHHMWCNPYGGKHQREDGCYRCWYTDERGTLVGLVMQVDGCSYEEAKEILSGRTPIGELEKKLEEFFANKQEVKIVNVNEFQLPPNTSYLNELNENHIGRIKTEDYLKKRKIENKNLMYCSRGKLYNIEYKNRIIIPYYDCNGNLVYFNSRSLDDDKLRYLGPPKQCGVGKSDVLYATRWPPAGSKIYLVEGEFDAMSLDTCGFNGIACGGKILGEKQLSIILSREYKVCLALDNDPSGFDAVVNIGRLLLTNRVKVTYLRPPKGIKDWNKMLELFSPEIVKGYIDKNEKTFSEWTPDILMSLTL